MGHGEVRLGLWLLNGVVGPLGPTSILRTNPRSDYAALSGFCFKRLSSARRTSAQFSAVIDSISALIPGEAAGEMYAASSGIKVTSIF